MVYENNNVHFFRKEEVLQKSMIYYSPQARFCVCFIFIAKDEARVIKESELRV